MAINKAGQQRARTEIDNLGIALDRRRFARRAGEHNRCTVDVDLGIPDARLTGTVDQLPSFKDDHRAVYASNQVCSSTVTSSLG